MSGYRLSFHSLRVGSAMRLVSPLVGFHAPMRQTRDRGSLAFRMTAALRPLPRLRLALSDASFLRPGGVPCRRAVRPLLGPLKSPSRVLAQAATSGRLGLLSASHSSVPLHGSVCTNRPADCSRSLGTSTLWWPMLLSWSQSDSRGVARLGVTSRLRVYCFLCVHAGTLCAMRACPSQTDSASCPVEAPLARRVSVCGASCAGLLPPGRSGAHVR